MSSTDRGRFGSPGTLGEMAWAFDERRQTGPDRRPPDGKKRVESFDSTNVTLERGEPESPQTRHPLPILACGLMCLQLAVVGCEPSAEVPAVVVADSAGMVLVEIESLASLDAPSASLEMVFNTAANGIELFRVTAGRVLRDGRVAVGNAGMQQVLLLTASGTSPRAIGREGAGPGEFRTISTLHRTSRGGFTVYDARLGRLSEFDAEGELVSTERLSPADSYTDLHPLSVGTQGQVLAHYGSLRRLPAVGVQRDSTPLLLFRQPGATPDTLSRWAMEETLFALEEDGWSATQVGFGRSLASFGTNQRAVIADTDRFDALVLDTSGRQLMRIRGGAASIPASDSEGEAWRRDKVARIRSDLPPELLARIRERLSQAPFRETYPALEALAVDVAGRVWIGAAVPYGEGERPWVVLGPEGTTVASLRLPKNAEILDITETQLLMALRDELDVEGVSLWEINWPTSDQ